MRLHLADPFPEYEEKEHDSGEVEPVLIAADIYGRAVPSQQMPSHTTSGPSGSPG
jgi:hypothetical protein